MASEWIRLTDPSNGETFYVNMAAASIMRERNHSTRIWFLGYGEDCADVKESMHEIIALLSEARHANWTKDEKRPADVIGNAVKAMRVAAGKESLS